MTRVDARAVAGPVCAGRGRPLWDVADLPGWGPVFSVSRGGVPWAERQVPRTGVGPGSPVCVPFRGPVHPWDSASHLCRALMRGGLEGGPGRRSARLRATHDTPTSVPTEVALGRPRGEVRGASVMETLPQWPASICF